MSSSTHPILRLLATDPKRVIGLISGASLDRIDAALVEIHHFGEAASARLIRFVSLPFPPGVREATAALLDPQRPSSAAEISTLNFRLGQAFADAAGAVSRDDEAPVDLVGSHGQTVWHQPPWMKERTDLIASTLQLGEPAVIAARTGAVTVADFRVADVAVSGEGAPLMPWADWVLYRKPGAVRALQHLGSAGKVTVVGDRLSDVFAFDTGPGHLLIDALAEMALPDEAAAERGGALSARGHLLPDVLDSLLDDDYLRRPPPKSTGRARYGRAFAKRLLEEHPRRAPADLLATVVEFTAETIARSYRAFVLPRLKDLGVELSEVLVSGGGAKNQTLLSRLSHLLAPIPVREFDDVGVPAEAREAVACALLAVECIHASPANIPVATGARRRAILGKICLPPV